MVTFTVYKNKFNFAIIKITEGESNLDVLLYRKEELLERTRPIIMNELKLESFLDDLKDIKETRMTHFELNRALKKDYDILFKTLDDNEKLYKSAPLVSVIKDINDNEEATIGSIKFYNDNVVIYNQLVTSFPANIIALFKGYKKKEFYSDEEKAMDEILNS